MPTDRDLLRFSDATPESGAILSRHPLPDNHARKILNVDVEDGGHSAGFDMRT